MNAPDRRRTDAPRTSGTDLMATSISPPPALSSDSFENAVASVVRRHYRELLGGVDAALSVFASMALKGWTKPLSLIFEAASGFGKTAIVQMGFPVTGLGLDKFVYRSDKFTPKAFVSHAANVSRAALPKVDLLPRLKGKVLLTKELAPIFRGREDDIRENFSILISVLDGEGFTSDSGIHGRRGYEEPILFNWIGATTPLPPSTHRLMSQLGTRLLFYEVPSVGPNEEQLLAYAQKDEVDTAEKECQKAVNEFLVKFFRTHTIASVEPNSIEFSKDRLFELVRWANFLVAGRTEVNFERDGTNWEPIAAMPAEGPWKVVDYFKVLARGHALLHGRTEIASDDLELVGQVALSSIPGHLRPIIRKLREVYSVNTGAVESLCRVTSPTARSYLKQLELLGIVELVKGASSTCLPDTATLAPPYRWLNSKSGGP